MTWTGTIQRRPIAADRDLDAPGGGVVLATPDEVAAWILATVGHQAKGADADARSKNVLRDHPGNVYRGVAARGKSVFATVHASATEVWDIRADYAPTMMPVCPACNGAGWIWANVLGKTVKQTCPMCSGQGGV